MWAKSREGKKWTTSVDTVNGLVMIGCRTVEVAWTVGMNEDERVSV